jgi:hypothetical protein
MFTEGARDFVSNQMHARIPNGLIHRGIWLNLCIDVNSFVRECFATPHTKMSLNIPTMGKEDAAKQNINGNSMKTIESI